MSPLTVPALLVGFVLLIVGGELLVRGSSGLGRTVGLSPVVVGLTVVALATSAPELAVSLDATLTGAGGLAIGNVVGSNITNVLLVLGLAAVLLPVVVRSQLLRFDVPAMVALSVLLLLLVLDGSLGRADGVLLVVLLIAYLTATVILGRRDGTDETDGRDGATTGSTARRPLADIALLLAGIGLLVGGSRLLVTASTQVAETLGVSDLVIGLTVVAIGTSLPEIATSVIAAVRGEREIAIGNVVGSNIFNIAAVLGITAAVAPGGMTVDAAAVRFDLPVMIAVAVALVPVAFTGRVVARWEAWVFVAYYAAYIAYVLLAAADHDALETFSTAMLVFVVPLTVLTLAVTVSAEIGRRRRRPAPYP